MKHGDNVNDIGDGQFVRFVGGN